MIGFDPRYYVALNTVRPVELLLGPCHHTNCLVYNLNVGHHSGGSPVPCHPAHEPETIHESRRQCDFQTGVFL
ncbi:hypothetical protein M378DRAFT_160764 [Amanita muscaria Koide BX008]|uniref:Uncharacterized protein n=1 Tax=Amanita muscaria (strain Koide BX008) TaxID=946122 RepID=A0A0C2XAK1_AMAMK|nr:hypothetical protein M378DRAFT_160764 [Amanita muscaria Koide BX008]